MSMTRWRGWFAVHRLCGSEQGYRIARSPIYRFTLRIPDGFGEWHAALLELRRRWDADGQPLALDPGRLPEEGTVWIHRTLGADMDHMFIHDDAPLPSAQLPGVQPDNRDAHVISHATHTN